MRCPKDQTFWDRDDLLALVASLREHVVSLQEQVVSLQDRVERLTAVTEGLSKEIADLRRAGKRQAAPFAKGTRATNPKRPGRKPGKGSFSYRKPPSADEVTGAPVGVKVTGDTCPVCGGKLQHERVDVAYVSDVPPTPQPVVTEFRVQVCRCMSCGKQVRGRHPDVAADQYGASAHRIGRRAMAAAHVLHYGVGVPVRKVPEVLKVLTGLDVTQGAITQDALRRAGGAVGSVYDRLRASIRDSRAVHTDDTGWRVGGEPAFLMAFETEEATVYQVRPRHRNEEVREVVPSDYGGVMVTDRGRSYDSQTLARVKQQKCMAHVLRSISDVVETKNGRGRSFGNRLKGLLREAMELWGAYHRGEAVDFAAAAERLRREVAYHLRDRPMTDPDNWRLQNELGWHNDRGNLLRFLDDPNIEPTNNRAERALRPAVIARKVSHCSKNTQGAEAFAAFTSVLRTLARNGDQSLVEGISQVFRAAPVRASPL
jgi:transposase|tara:strand:- start:149 stop:1603 length:1455 start_codon:yes stop_codon:yes gene_type:complete